MQPKRMHPPQLLQPARHVGGIHLTVVGACDIIYPSMECNHISRRAMLWRAFDANGGVVLLPPCLSLCIAVMQRFLILCILCILR